MDLSSFLAVVVILLLVFLLFKLVVFLAKLVFKPKNQDKNTEGESIYNPDFIEQDKYVQECEDVDTVQDESNSLLNK